MTLYLKHKLILNVYIKVEPFIEFVERRKNNIVIRVVEAVKKFERL